MPISQPTQLELINDATRGFDKLLDNDLPEAKAILSEYPDSPFHLCGAGISAFLAAALGQEDTELHGALDKLLKAETAAATRTSAKSRPKTEPVTVFPPGTEYKVLVADAVIGQGLVHVLTESYMEFMKAIYKMNRAYKGFGEVYKIVYPIPVTEKDSLADIFTSLNASYLANSAKAQASANPSHASTASYLLSWGRSSRKATHHELREKSASSASLANPRLSALTDSLEHTSLATSDPASLPVSLSTSRASSIHARINPKPRLRSEDGVAVPPPAWEGDALSTLVIAGTSFGNGLFGLIFSILPPKLRKLIGWFGFANSNRHVSLRLLTVAASTGDDVHGYFATLSLLTFYGIILLMAGWQAEEEYLIGQCEAVLLPILEKFENGTLWILNDAKLKRMRYQTREAIAVMESALAKGSQFREADSVLVFELAWTLLSDAQWEKAGEAFLRMRTLNNWSHSTYVFIAVGCFLEVTDRSAELDAKIDTLLDELPSLFGKKRMLGEPPSTEIFITRKIEVYKAKHARWVAAGRLPRESKYQEAIRLSPASELGIFWNTMGKAPRAAIQLQIDRLSAFTPAPPSITHDTVTLPSPHTSASLLSSSHDLDTLDELATRDLLLGSLHLALGNLRVAKLFLQSCLDAQPHLQQERWTGPLATFQLAATACKEADLEVKEGGDAKTVWKKRLPGIEKLVDSIFSTAEYDLKSRLESRAQMIRDQIAERKAKLDL